VLVATPGRILQHLEESPTLDAARCQVLVVDEADRVVDMGFAPQLDAVVAYLPAARHTMLFSATLAGFAGTAGDALSNRLAKLRNLTDAATVEYVAAREDRALVANATGGAPAGTTAAPTPPTLDQKLVVCGLEEKLDVLYAFVKAHLKAKTIVFVSACAQARFLLEALRGTQPGVPLMALHGKLSQPKRTAVYYDFAKRKAAVLFATDVAARGLDFAGVDWVVQLDAPEDAEAYVHRAGRAARNGSRGNAMLVALPSEAETLEATLAAARIPVKKVALNPKRRFSVTAHVAALVAKRPEVKALAQKCFSAYVRSVALASDKRCFDAAKLPLKAYATSLGLAAAPRVKLPADADRAKLDAHAAKNQNRKLQRLKDQIAAAKRAKRGDAPPAPAPAEAEASSSDDEAADPLVRKEGPERDVDAIVVPDAPVSRKVKKQRRLKIDGDGASRAAGARRTTFDDDGAAVGAAGLAAPEPAASRADLAARHDAFVARARDRLAATDADARAKEKDRRKALKRARKGPKREAAAAAGPTLASDSD